MRSTYAGCHVGITLIPRHACHVPRIFVIASKGGAPTNPDWYRNLRANPRVTVEVGPERFEANATVAKGVERRRLYDLQAARMPAFKDYEKKTSREIPVVVLERAG